jgi:hypothetical protein
VNAHFRAAAESMRRILVDHARRKRADTQGGGAMRSDVAEDCRMTVPEPDTLLAIDEALEKPAAEDPASADVARLRRFAGLSVDEVAQSLGRSRTTAFRDRAYARA